MAFLGLRLPHETARLLNGIDVPGKRESLGHFHITMLHLGKEVPIEALQKALLATYEVTSRTRPFTVRTSMLSSFPKNEDGVPVICRVDSDPLHELRAKVCRSYDVHGVEYSKKFPEYKPHVTLAWAEDEVPERRIPTVEWGAHELVLWGGDSGDTRLVMTFPFSLDEASEEVSEEIATRVAKRFAAVGKGLFGGPGP